MLREITVAMLHVLEPNLEPARVEEMVVVVSQVARTRQDAALIITANATENGLLAFRYPLWRMEPLVLSREIVEDVNVGAVQACGRASSLSARIAWHLDRDCAETLVSGRTARLVRWLLAGPPRTYAVIVEEANREETSNAR